MKEKVLVVGGAGYIGSHVVLELCAAGYEPVILDSFVNSDHRVAARLGVEVRRACLSAPDQLAQVMNAVCPAAVMHFAAFAYVGESVTDPAKYYHNNFAGTLNLLDAMRRIDCRRLIFSSTCATYGVPVEVPITENCPQQPINPYGHSKLMVERVLQDYDYAYGIKSVVFRYFNAAGADAEGRVGEYHIPETHAVPLVIKAALGRGGFKVFGNNYATPDGTCIRDYIHVTDIAAAHILGLKSLLLGAVSDVFNIGNGQGYSVLELIRAVEAVSGRKVPYAFDARRAGDPPRLIASAEKIRNVLGWQPKYPGIEEIVGTAWRWHTGSGAEFANW